MKIKKMIITYCVLAAVFFFTAPVYAEHGGFNCASGGVEGMGNRQGKDRMMDEVMEEIGITPDQKQQIEKLREENKGESKEIKTRRKAAKKAIRTELDQPGSDKAKLGKLVNESTDLYRKQTELRIKSILDIKSVLTPEQFEKMHQKLEIKKEVKKELRKQGKGKRSKFWHGKDKV